MLHYAVQKVFLTEQTGKQITGVGKFRDLLCRSSVLRVCLQIIRTPRVYNMHDKYMHSLYSFMFMYQYVLCLVEASGFKQGVLRMMLLPTPVHSLEGLLLISQ